MRVLIVGGGPAGMAAAISSAENGAEAILLEKNEKCGKKLYITGKGRCNVTNSATGDEFLGSVVRNPRFLRSSLAGFDSASLVLLLERAGLRLKLERGGRYFPESDKASDVTKALQRLMSEAGAQVRLGVEVKRVLTENGAVCGVGTRDGDIAGDRVIIATGGVSYPLTGSTGDGHAMSGALGHRITALTPSLVGIVTSEAWPKAAQGLTLKNVALTASRGKKRIYKEQGELLLTHFGVSGPLALTLSAHLSGETLDGVSVTVDLKPALSEDELIKRLAADIDKNGAKLLKNSLVDLLPMNMIEHVLAECCAPGGIQSNQLNAAQRLSLARAIKGMPLTPTALMPMDEAIITRGGVSTSDIDPKTMESKLIRGLFFAGEVIDVDALTGGFNLQIAFTTGWRAGISAAI